MLQKVRIEKKVWFLGAIFLTIKLDNSEKLSVESKKNWNC
jgi:hypothetical protein